MKSVPLKFANPRYCICRHFGMVVYAHQSQLDRVNPDRNDAVYVLAPRGLGFCWLQPIADEDKGRPVKWMVVVACGDRL